MEDWRTAYSNWLYMSYVIHSSVNVIREQCNQTVTLDYLLMYPCYVYIIHFIRNHSALYDGVACVEISIQMGSGASI